MECLDPAVPAAPSSTSNPVAQALVPACTLARVDLRVHASPHAILAGKKPAPPRKSPKYKLFERLPPPEIHPASGVYQRSAYPSSRMPV
jgi:hypothetical protein